MSIFLSATIRRILRSNAQRLSSCLFVQGYAATLVRCLRNLFHVLKEKLLRQAVGYRCEMDMIRRSHRKRFLKIVIEYLYQGLPLPLFFQPYLGVPG